jgi:two-component system KDP operon response regulator KdpE
VAHRVLLLDITGAEDDALREQLVQGGFIVQSAEDDPYGSARLPDVAVLRASETSRSKLSASLRALPGVPAVVICPRHDEELIVDALEAGADRVLVAPLSRRELIARVAAIAGKSRRARPWPQRPGLFRAGDVEIDAAAHIATKAGRPLSLTPTEFRLLTALARCGGSLVSNEDLIDEVWGASDVDGAHNLRLYVRYLRQKIEDDPARPRLLVNHRSVGYRLAVEPQREATP